jgi:hypothetical protein
MVQKGALTGGHTKGCGCGFTARGPREMHGAKNTPEYRVWNHVKDRCGNPNNTAYDYYGGRGITVCDRWRDSFQNFFDDMGPRPSPKHSIDRVDNDKGYCPENCRWATKEEQANNTRTNVLLEWNGRTQTLAQWARETGIDDGVIGSRLRANWPIERALSTPTRSKKTA